MNSFELKVDPKEAQYTRFAGAVLNMLKAAVQRRTAEGLSQREIAGRMGVDAGALSRTLNGRVRNLTLKTVSDILWATEHEPVEISADALEDISGNYCPQHKRAVVASSSDVRPAIYRVARPLTSSGNATRMSGGRLERYLEVSAE